MQKAMAIAALAALGLAGCSSSGMSDRETRGQNYGTLMYAMYEIPPAEEAEPQPLLRPARVGVAQVGEVAPSQQMLDRLRKQRDVFARVDPVPGVMNTISQPYYRNAPDLEEQQRVDHSGRQQIERMRSLARGMGLDYLLVYGGTVDHGTAATPLTVADLTIVGAFVVPSKVSEANARASGALIDVHSGRVILLASADRKGRAFSPTVSDYASEQNLVKNVRNEVSLALAEDVIVRMQSQ